MSKLKSGCKLTDLVSDDNRFTKRKTDEASVEKGS